MEEEKQTNKIAGADEEDDQLNVNTHCLFFHQDSSACVGCESAGETNVVATSCLQCDFDAGVSFKLCSQCFDIRHGVKTHGPAQGIEDELKDNNNNKSHNEAQREDKTRKDTDNRNNLGSLKQYNVSHVSS